MQITAGEYGFNLDYFTRMIAADAVDFIQADATRCSISVFIQVAHLCQAHYLPFSAHTAPALHVHVCCSLLPVRHIEYFYDHVRIEQMFFDDLPQPHRGELRPNLDLPGMGLELKEQDVEGPTARLNRTANFCTNAPARSETPITPARNGWSLFWLWSICFKHGGSVNSDDFNTTAGA